MEHLNFPFIMKFFRTYKDNTSIYFLIEYINGLELWDVIRIINNLSDYDCQFYIGSLILAIEYLHSKKIMYRDLKPENIMIDQDGYLHLIDMGTAKIMNDPKQKDRTYTIIGTPHYMAPEIIKGKGYSFACDLWSIGVCLYEFYCS